MAAKLSAIDQPLGCPKNPIQQRCSSLGPYKHGSNSKQYGTKLPVCRRPEADAVKPGIPVAGAPIFDHVKTAGLEVIVEQMPEAEAS